MSGHSKWHQIRHKKGIADQKRGALFTKLGRNITIAARNGGDQAMNPSLALSVQKAKAANMTNDAIDRAIKKGTGELKDESIFQEVYYEGYAPGNIPMIVSALTDNTNRTVAHVRHAFSKHGGNMGNSGSVAHMFEKKGVILAKLSKEASADEAEMAIIESGAEDYDMDDNTVTIYTDIKDLHSAESALQQSGFFTMEDSGIKYLPLMEQAIPEDKKAAYEAFLEHVEDSDDIQEVYSAALFEGE